MFAEDVETDQGAQDAITETDPGQVAQTEDYSRRDPSEDVSPVDDPANADQGTFTVRLNDDPDAGLVLEGPVAVAVPNLYANLEPLPHPNEVADEEGNVPEGVEVAVQTENGWERPEDSQPEAQVELDEYDRLVVSDSPVTVPAAVARVLDDQPYLVVETS